MKLREEMEARLKASTGLVPASTDNPPIDGWSMESEAFDPPLQAAVDQLLGFTNVLVDMVPQKLRMWVASCSVNITRIRTSMSGDTERRPFRRNFTPATPPQSGGVAPSTLIARTSMVPRSRLLRRHPLSAC
jgi:hypothetical protein